MTTANRLVDRPSPPSRIAHVPHYLRADVLLAVAAFLGLCLAVLMRAPQMLEPDDYAYRASIVALSHGHILLSNAQYLALEHQLGSASSAVGPGGGGAIQQWDHLANGLWISEKNPGYPFLAVPFQWLGALRLTPLFYGALGCLGLWFGAPPLAWALGRRLRGRPVLHLGGGARVRLARDDGDLYRRLARRRRRRRAVVDPPGDRCRPAPPLPGRPRSGILALVAATLTRYTDVVALGVAILAIIALARRVGIAWRTLQIWTTGLVLSGLGILALRPVRVRRLGQDRLRRRRDHVLALGPVAEPPAYAGPPGAGDADAGARARRVRLDRRAGDRRPRWPIPPHAPHGGATRSWPLPWGRAGSGSGGCTSATAGPRR